MRSTDKWVNAVSILLLAVILYHSAQSGNIAGMLNAIFPLFAPYFLFKFLSVRQPSQVKSIRLGGFLLAIVQLVCILGWIYTEIAGNSKIEILIWMVPLSLAALGVGWWLGKIIK